MARSGDLHDFGMLWDTFLAALFPSCPKFREVKNGSFLAPTAGKFAHTQVKSCIQSTMILLRGLPRISSQSTQSLLRFSRHLRFSGERKLSAIRFLKKCVKLRKRNGCEEDSHKNHFVGPASKARRLPLDAFFTTDA